MDALKGPGTSTNIVPVPGTIYKDGKDTVFKAKNGEYYSILQGTLVQSTLTYWNYVKRKNNKINITPQTPKPNVQPTKPPTSPVQPAPPPKPPNISSSSVGSGTVSYFSFPPTSPTVIIQSPPPSQPRPRPAQRTSSTVANAAPVAMPMNSGLSAFSAIQQFALSIRG